jgi:hypothetical protein
MINIDELRVVVQILKEKIPLWQKYRYLISKNLSHGSWKNTSVPMMRFKKLLKSIVHQLECINTTESRLKIMEYRNVFNNMVFHYNTARSLEREELNWCTHRNIIYHYLSKGKDYLQYIPEIFDILTESFVKIQIFWENIGTSNKSIKTAKYIADYNKLVEKYYELHEA